MTWLHYTIWTTITFWVCICGFILGYWKGHRKGLAVAAEMLEEIKGSLND